LTKKLENNSKPKEPVLEPHREVVKVVHREAVKEVVKEVLWDNRRRRFLRRDPEKCPECKIVIRKTAKNEFIINHLIVTFFP
jgi:hypothetical protein